MLTVLSCSLSLFALVECVADVLTKAACSPSLPRTPRAGETATRFTPPPLVTAKPKPDPTRPTSSTLYETPERDHFSKFVLHEASPKADTGRGDGGPRRHISSRQRMDKPEEHQEISPRSGYVLPTAMRIHACRDTRDGQIRGTAGVPQPAPRDTLSTISTAVRTSKWHPLSLPLSNGAHRR